MPTLPPPLDSALATRVVDIKLLALDERDLAEVDRVREMSSDPDILEAKAKARALAPRMLARALLNAQRYAADVSAMKSALIRAKHSPRTADLIAALAAGRRLLMTDTPLTPEDADDDVKFWSPLLDKREQNDTVSNPGADLLGHIMAWESGQHLSERRITIGELVAKWAAGEVVSYAVLKNHGLRLYEGNGPDGRPGPWLLVANKHPGLAKMLARTQWKDHRATLEYLDQLGPEHKTWAVKSLKYGTGQQHRGLAIPLAPWLEKPFARSAGVPSGVPGDDHEF